MPRVQVLLSTYNGQAHVARLIDSVLGQQGVDVELLVRDDGSTDDTLALLATYASRPNVRVVPGRNLGAVRSFFWLLQHASRAADAIALADQDDVWLPDKLRSAADALARLPRDEPALYCSALTLVDNDLREIGRSAALRRAPSFENSLVENVVTGCTAVLNQRAVAVVTGELPATAHMHDWWLYQVVAGLGRVVYDPHSHILYRQHGGNVVGAAAGAARGWLARLRRVAARRRVMLPPTQLRELLRIHGRALPGPHRALLTRFVQPQTVRDRLALALFPGLVCQARWKAVAVRCLLLLGHT